MVLCLLSLCSVRFCSWFEVGFYEFFCVLTVLLVFSFSFLLLVILIVFSLLPVGRACCCFLCVLFFCFLFFDALFLFLFVRMFSSVFFCFLFVFSIVVCSVLFSCLASICWFSLFVFLLCCLFILFSVVLFVYPGLSLQFSPFFLLGLLVCVVGVFCDCMFALCSCGFLCVFFLFRFLFR